MNFPQGFDSETPRIILEPESPAGMAKVPEVGVVKRNGCDPPIKGSNEGFDARAPDSDGVAPGE